MKEYTVYLFRCPNCIRGWLSYIEPSSRDRATLSVIIEAESGAKAKNKAITMINKAVKNRDISELKIKDRNYDCDLWGIDQFEDLKKIF